MYLRTLSHNLYSLSFQWDWIRDDFPSFRSLQGGLLVAPILQKLILNREPERVLSWVDAVCKWPFSRIIPCHLSNDLKAGPREFRAAFDFLYEPAAAPASFAFPWTTKKSDRAAGYNSKVFQEEAGFLSGVSEQLTKQGVLYPEAPLVRRK